MHDHVSIARAEKQLIKCVVCDLDNTIWDGILLEDHRVQLRENVVEVLAELDRRGILLSIASRNNHELAIAKLGELGVRDYFLYPQINWNAKSSSIRSIAKSLNIGLDSVLFVDDQQFEREEVQFELSDVRCVAAADFKQTLTEPMMTPRFITPESKLRRKMYLNDMERQRAESEFVGASEEFLSQLDMIFTIKHAQAEDLQRAEELTIRTNQLNTTGYTYSYDELDSFRQSPDHLLLVASLNDKYGTYGTVGLALIEKGSAFWNIKLLLMSCRVMSRGVGTIMLHHIMARTKEAKGCLRAEFISNERNRMMLVTYKFGGFREIQRVGDMSILENELSGSIPINPSYVKVEIVE